VSFDVAAESYDRFMGRYAVPLAPQLVDFAQIERGQRVLDVGCGPGALTNELVERVGADAVEAVDPSPPFVAALRERQPDVNVQLASAESLPFIDASFDAALAQLVVHFMTDPVAGLREMARVTRTGGVLASCVWDFGSGQAPLSLFWRAARDVDPSAGGEGELPGTREGHQAELYAAAGLRDIEETSLTVSVEHPSFEEWWEPYTRGVGPAGGYLARMEPERRDALRERCRELLPPAPFTITSRAWATRGRAA
jgi:ubiquinone/menaquinone biosynthesis C-methylase UbiE